MMEHHSEAEVDSEVIEAEASRVKEEEDTIADPEVIEVATEVISLKKNSEALPEAPPESQQNPSEELIAIIL